MDIVNPSTGEVYASAPQSDETDVDLACKAAGEAFETWRWTTPSERQRALLKLADVVGVAPSLLQCASCGRTDGLSRFSFGGGGSVCDRCMVEGAVKLRSGVIDYLAALAGSELGALPAPDTALSAEAMGIARRFVEYHLDRKLTSLAVME